MRPLNLMYLLDRLETAEAMTETLGTMRINAEDCHVLSKDEESVRKHHLHSASDMERSDMRRSSERGALLGIGCALVFAIGMMIANPLGFRAEWGAFLFSTLLATGFGAWVGGMVGVRHSNFRFAPFYAAIEEGKYLFIIELKDSSRLREVKQTMFERHPKARLVGEEEERLDPFMSHRKSEVHVRHLH